MTWNHFNLDEIIKIKFTYKIYKPAFPLSVVTTYVYSIITRSLKKWRRLPHKAWLVRWNDSLRSEPSSIKPWCYYYSCHSRQAAWCITVWFVNRLRRQSAMAVCLQKALTVCVLVTQLNPCWKGIKLQVRKYDAPRQGGWATYSKLVPRQMNRLWAS